jgi:hypothetical protein
VTTILSNPDITDEEPRTRLYSGQVHVDSASPGSLTLVEHARNLSSEAFGSEDPQTAHYDTLAEDFALRESRHDLVLVSPGAFPGRICHG